MNLLPPEVRAPFAHYPIGSQDGRGMQAIVVAKFFFPSGRYTLFVTEGEPEGDDDFLFFGYCLSALGEDCDEWGYTRLTELQSVERDGLTIERDLYFPAATKTVAGALKSHLSSS
ncbi:MAG TPA: DUF2958 domain-containing protein [Thermoanaerobaculia bacterium]|nr:DUF2958 domain-containing protein [Thermoanaerobaculia bacterium]